MFSRTLHLSGKFNVLARLFCHVCNKLAGSREEANSSFYASKTVYCTKSNFYFSDLKRASIGSLNCLGFANKMLNGSYIVFRR